MKVPMGWRLDVVGGAISSSQYGSSVPSSVLGTRPIVGMRNLVDGVVSMDHLACVDEHAQDWSALTLNPGDILLNRTNSPDLVGKVGIVRDQTTAVFASYLVRLKPDLEQITPEYLAYWLGSPMVQGLLRKLTTRGVSQANINPSTLRQHCPLLIPPLPEQRKIAEILRTWDDAIEQTDQLLNRLSGKHKLLLQGLVAAHAHEPHVALRDLVEPVKTRNTVGETNVLTSSARDGLVSQSEYFNKSVAGKNLAEYYLMHRGDFAYNRSASASHPFGVFRKLDRYDRGVISTLYLCFRLRGESPISAGFLQSVFNSEALNRQLSLICHEGARSHGLLNISQTDFYQLVVPVPSRKAQDAATEALDASALEIELLQRKAELLRTQKRGLIQKLLTGQVRVNAVVEDEPGGLSDE